MEERTYFGQSYAFKDEKVPTCTISQSFKIYEFHPAEFLKHIDTLVLPVSLNLIKRSENHLEDKKYLEVFPNLDKMIHEDVQEGHLTSNMIGTANYNGHSISLVMLPVSSDVKFNHNLCWISLGYLRDLGKPVHAYNKVVIHLPGLIMPRAKVNIVIQQLREAGLPANFIIATPSLKTLEERLTCEEEEDRKEWAEWRSKVDRMSRSRRVQDAV